MRLAELFESKYHRDIFIPNSVSNELKEYVNIPYSLKYSMHAEEEAEKEMKKFSIGFDMPSVIKFKIENVFEVVTNDITEEIQKIGVRLPLNSKYDMSIIFNPNNGLVITFWLNRNTDLHSTLKTALYTQSPNVSTSNLYK